MAGHPYSSGHAWRDTRRALTRYRRPVAAVLVAAAALLGVSAARPRPAATEGVWVAAHDLPGGIDLRSGDVRVVRFAAGLVPGHALDAARPLTGRFLAAPVRQGEPLTDERLLSPALLAATGTPDDRAVPVRVTDAAATAALVQAGARVDVLASSDPSSGVVAPTEPIVQNVEVLAVAADAGDEESDGSGRAGLVIVAVTSAQAAALASLPSGGEVSVALRRES